MQAKTLRLSSDHRFITISQGTMCFAEKMTSTDVIITFICNVRTLSLNSIINKELDLKGGGKCYLSFLYLAQRSQIEQCCSSAAQECEHTTTLTMQNLFIPLFVVNLNSYQTMGSLIIKYLRQAFHVGQGWLIIHYLLMLFLLAWKSAIGRCYKSTAWECNLF